MTGGGGETVMGEEFLLVSWDALTRGKNVHSGVEDLVTEGFGVWGQGDSSSGK